MANDIFQQLVVPEKPKIIAEERVYVYTPKATNDSKGIASFRKRDFNVNDGNVSLLWPMQMDVETLSNPLENVSRVKVLEDEFESTGKDATLANPITGTTYTSKTAEIRLKRTGRDVFVKPDLVMLSEHDFISTETQEGYIKYTLKTNDPFEEPSLVKVSPKDFASKSGIVQIQWPFANNEVTTKHTDGYGLVKIAEGSKGYLKYSEDGLLELDYDKTFASDKATIRPIYGGTADSGFVDIDGYVIDGKAVRNEQGNILIAITKDAVGLTNVANRAFSSYSYGEFGEAMQEHFDKEFGTKLDTDIWNGLFNDWNPPSDEVRTPQLRFDSLTAKGNALQDEVDTLKAIKLFLGYYPTIEALEHEHPASEKYIGCYASVLNTSSHWMIEYNQTEYVWVDTHSNELNITEYLETNAKALKPNGVASVGASRLLVSSDHVHPVDETRLAKNIYQGSSVTFTSKFNDNNSSDFVYNLWEDKYGAYIFNRKVNIPYIRKAKNLHNYAGAHGIFTDSESSNENYWAGSVEAYNEEVSEMPNNTIFFVDDGENYITESYITDTELDKAGVTIDFISQNEKLVTVNEDEVSDLVGVPLILNKIGNRYKLTTMNLGIRGQMSVTTHRTLDNKTVLGTTEYTHNRVLFSDTFGTVQPSNIHQNSIIKTANNGEEVTLQPDRIIVSKGSNVVDTYDTGTVNGRLLVSNGNHGLKEATFTAKDRFVIARENGVLETVDDIEPSNFIISALSEDATILESNRLLLSGPYNTVQTVTTTGTNIPIVSNGNGAVKQVTLSSYKLVYTDAQGGLASFPMTPSDHGKYIGVDLNGYPTLIQNSNPTTLPIETLTSAPTSDNNNGTKLVILNSAPTIFYKGYLYLY